MDKKIVLTIRFRKNFDARIEYLVEKWSSASAFRFIEKVYEKIEAIKKNPSIGEPSVQIKNVRSLPLKPYNRIYYREEKAAIYILALIDSRRKFNRYK